MTKFYDDKTKHGPCKKPESMSFDSTEFIDFLENTGWPDEQKSEYIALLWNLVCDFVSLGFGIHPLQAASEPQNDQPENLVAPVEANDEAPGSSPRLGI